MEESSREATILDPERVRRNTYEERRRFVENKFANETPKIEHETLENGGSVKILTSIAEIPKELRSENNSGKTRVSVYVPTMWYTNPQTKDQRENRLSSTMLSGDIDFAIQIKAEGMNDEAYLDREGEGACQSNVAAVAVRKLEQSLLQLGVPKGSIEFKVLGYSEGSTQGASVAAQILKQELGTVAEYVSIGGAGLIGAENQLEANPGEFVQKAIKSVTQNEPPPDGKRHELKSGRLILVDEGPDTYFVPVEIIGGKNGGLEGALNDSESSKKPFITRALQPEAYWIKRLGFTLLGISEDNPVPRQRVKAVATLNRDYDYLAQKGIPMIVFTETRDTFFDNKAIRESVKQLRERNPNAKIVQISSNAGHEDPWKNPSGIAFILQVIREKTEIR